jgi:hypothetical protein
MLYKELRLHSSDHEHSEENSKQKSDIIPLVVWMVHSADNVEGRFAR